MGNVSEHELGSQSTLVEIIALPLTCYLGQVIQPLCHSFFTFIMTVITYQIHRVVMRIR